MSKDGFPPPHPLSSMLWGKSGVHIRVRGKLEHNFVNVALGRVNSIFASHYIDVPQCTGYTHYPDLDNLNPAEGCMIAGMLNSHCSEKQGMGVPGLKLDLKCFTQESGCFSVLISEGSKRGVPRLCMQWNVPGTQMSQK